VVFGVAWLAVVEGEHGDLQGHGQALLQVDDKKILLSSTLARV